MANVEDLIDYLMFERLAGKQMAIHSDSIGGSALRLGRGSDPQDSHLIKIPIARTSSLPYGPLHPIALD